MDTESQNTESLVTDPQLEETPDSGITPEGAEARPLQPRPDLAAALDRLEVVVHKGFAEILRAFADKLAYDESKDEQITRLHEELQEHKRDLVARIKRPLIQGLVRLHDDLGKVVTSLRTRSSEELTPERFFCAFEGFEDDIELLLAQHGVECFVMPEDAFDPRHQTALRTEVSAASEKAGTIAARLRPGFVEGEIVLQKERVAVYTASGATSQLPRATAASTSPAQDESNT